MANAVTYSYDPVGNLLSATDAFSSLTYTYDDRDRVRTEDNAGTPEAPHAVLTYLYDDVGNVRSVTDTINGTLGATTGYEYDGLNRTTRITQTGTGTSDKRFDFAYNELGQFQTIDRYSDLLAQDLVVRTRYQYDDLNRLVDLRHTNADAVDLAFYEYDYDQSSRISRINSVDGVADYSYDDTDQLTGADYSDPSLTDENYRYDENGNRVDSHLHGGSYETGLANRLLSDGTHDYQYDAEGNMTRRTETTTGDYRVFEWDHRNRLVAVNDFVIDGTPTQIVEFSYDVLGRRIRKEVDALPADGMDGVVTHFIYDGVEVILDYVDPDGNGLAAATLDHRYLHGPVIDFVLVQGDGTNVRWLLGDHLGTIQDLVMQNNESVRHIVYDSFGQTAHAENLDTRYLFTGREYDLETGLQYNRRRYYSSDLGRFLSGRSFELRRRRHKSLSVRVE